MDILIDLWLVPVSVTFCWNNQLEILFFPEFKLTKRMIEAEKKKVMLEMGGLLNNSRNF